MFILIICTCIRKDFETVTSKGCQLEAVTTEEVAVMEVTELCQLLKNKNVISDDYILDEFQSYVLIQAYILHH